MLGRSGKCPGCGGQIQIPSRPKIKPTAIPSPPIQTSLRPPPRPIPHLPTIVQPSAITPTTTNVFTPAGQPSAAQVNVHNSNASNSLGISSLILGIFSLFICWIPLVGLGLRLITLLLGISGHRRGNRAKGKGIGFAVSGMAVSGIGVLLGFSSLSLFRVSPEGLNNVAEQIDRDLNRQPQQASPVDEPPSPSANISNDEDNTDPYSANNSSPATEFHHASRPLKLGNIQLEIAAVRVGKVPMYREFVQDESESVDELLTIWLTITNISSNKKIDYQGWMSDYASLLDIDAELTDDNENRYRGVSFGAGTVVKDANTNESIYPGKSIKDAIVLELPIDGAKHLDLPLLQRDAKNLANFASVSQLT